MGRRALLVSNVDGGVGEVIGEFFVELLGIP